MAHSGPNSAWDLAKLRRPQPRSSGVAIGATPPPMRLRTHHERRRHHRIQRADRLRGREPFRRPRLRRGRRRQRHARASSSAPRHRPPGTGAGSRRARRASYEHADLDIRDRDGVDKLFAALRRGDLALVIHAAAQPSHDWAAREPFTDFDINAVGTLNLLEATRQHAPETPFIFCSTNKVYGDTPELAAADRGGDPLRAARRSPLLRRHHARTCRSTPAAQPVRRLEARRRRARPGVRALLRPADRRLPRRHADRARAFGDRAARLPRLRDALRDHRRRPYTIFGYKGKQVRDAIHSRDLIAAFEQFFRAPRVGRGLQHRRRPHAATASVIEAIEIAEEITGNEIPTQLRGGEPDRRPPLVDRQQRPLRASTTPSGSWSTGSSGSWARSTSRAPSAGRSDHLGIVSRRALIASCPARAGVADPPRATRRTGPRRSRRPRRRPARRRPRSAPARTPAGR